MFLALERSRPARQSTVRSIDENGDPTMNYYQVAQHGPEELLIRPTKSDWERLRPFICESYKKQQTVRQIREALITNGYGVSERMLKGRLAKWNMTNKNNTFKPHHVKAVIRKSEECLEQGKTPPAYVINGRKRTYDDAVKLLCRWKKTEVVQHLQLPPYRQPSSTDLVEMAFSTDEMMQERTLLFPMNNSIPRSPSLSPDQARSSKTLTSVRHWYNDFGPVLLEREQWHHCCSIYSLLENCQTAMQSAQTYGVKSQWNALHALAVRAAQSVNNLSTSSFLNALRWLTLFEKDPADKEPVSWVVMNILSSVAAAQLGSSHPIALLFQDATRSPISTELVSQLWDVTRETVVSQTSGEQYADFLGHSLARVGAIMINLRAYDLAERYLQEGEEVGVTSGDFKVLGCARWLKGRLRRLQNNFAGDDGAINILQAHAQFLRDHEMQGTFLSVAVQEELGKCYDVLSEWEKAAECFAAAIALHEESGANNAGRKVSLLHGLDDALMKQGKTVESFALQGKYPDAFTIE